MTDHMAERRADGGCNSPPGFTAAVSVYPSTRSYQPVGLASAPLQRAPQHAHCVLRGYDPRWPQIFAAERRRIQAALGSAARGVEHVGSSSIPGLWGRAEIDILVGVGDATDVDAGTRLLGALGYETLAQSPLRSQPYCLMLRRAALPFELLVVEHGGALWNRHVGLRNYLRRDPLRALAYGRQKSRWAARYGADTPAYKEAKRRFWAAIHDQDLRTASLYRTSG